MASHAKKSDKETQSPVLKIFKDIMQKEKSGLSKTSLVKERQKERKRKQSSVFRSRSDEHRSCESNISENGHRVPQYKVAHQQRARDGVHSGTRSISSERDHNKNTAETCSCRSCALKRIAGSTYTGLVCLGFLFVISISLTILLLCRTLPSTSEQATVQTTSTTTRSRKHSIDGDSLRKRVESLKAKSGRLRNEFGDTLVAFRGSDERRYRDDTITQQRSIPGFVDPRVRDSSALEDLEDMRSKSLRNILDNEELSYEQSNERIRNFYKKLIQVDAQIQHLRNDLRQLATDEKISRSMESRSKRSLKTRKCKTHRRKSEKVYLKGDTKRRKRTSRSNDTNGGQEATKLVMENNKILFEFQPANRRNKYPKCSHTPDNLKSHETQLKHPFYKNSQRLDELLDRFIHNNVIDISDPFGLDVILNSTKLKCKHPKLINEEQKEEHSNVSSQNKSVDEVAKELYEDTLHEAMNSETNTYYFDPKLTLPMSTVSDDAIGLSVSTLLSSGTTKVVDQTSFKVLSPRKLMQVDEEDDDTIGYEDMKVIAEDIDAENLERQRHRKKRMDIAKPDIDVNPFISKHNPPSIHNPNWKGPMPLYPDELNLLINDTPKNQAHIPYKAVEIEDIEGNKNDVDYMEDYLNNKYESLVKMAQAYSDYGVLDGKKDVDRGDKNQPTDVTKMTNSRVKLTADGAHDANKDSSSEGIRFEVRPGQTHSETNIVKGIEKHLKDFKIHYKPCQSAHTTTLLPTNNELELLFSPPKPFTITTKNPTDHTIVNDCDENGIIFSIGKSRSLLSFQSDKSEDGEDAEVVDNFNIKLKNDSENESYRARNVAQVNINKNNSISECQNDISDTEALDELFRVEENGNLATKTLINNILSPKFSNDLKRDFTEVDTFAEAGNDVIRNKRLFRESINNDDLINLNKSRVLAEIMSKGGIDDIGKIIGINDRVLNNNNTEMGPGEFLLLMSNWFRILAGMSLDRDGHEFNNYSLNTVLIPGSEITTLNTTEESVMFPMYDSDMIENIAHRSRVLLSIEDKQTNITDNTDRKTEMEDTDIIRKSTKVSDVTTEIERTNSITNLTQSNATITIERDENKTDESKVSFKENKTIVKRSAPEESNLIFWNDIYDDEYGINIDPPDTPLRNEHSLKYNGIMKKSERWIQDKIKKLADSVKGGSKLTKMKEVKRSPRNSNDFENLYLKQTVHPNPENEERESEEEESELEMGKESDFNAMTMRMKEVCRNAARAVQKTRNLGVREDKKGDSMTTSLMQQLVRLMSDLVDFQVQQRICMKLPADLRDFLVYLTSPDRDAVPKFEKNVSFKDNRDEEEYDAKDEKSSGYDLESMTTPKRTTDESQSDKTLECLSVIRSVKDLMDQYNKMTDDEKNSMAGVKEYLLKQLGFLRKQLAGLNLYDIAKNPLKKREFPVPIRIRRDLSPNQHQKRNRRRRRSKKKTKRKPNKFIKNYSKKHTRSTLSNLDGLIVTDTKIFRREDTTTGEIKIEEELAQSTEQVRAKKNLRDVYYKAISDAKKFTTVKNFHKKANGKIDV